MSLDAVFGLAGVALGSLTTSVLTVYRDRLTVRQENAVRDQQYERSRQLALHELQRESILTLQAAAAELIAAAYAELDRMLVEYRKTGEWAARIWETPTAVDGLRRYYDWKPRVPVSSTPNFALSLVNFAPVPATACGPRASTAQNKPAKASNPHWLDFTRQ